MTGLILIGILFVGGLILWFVGWIMFIVAGFRQHALWGLGILFCIPFVQLIFLIKYWSEARNAFLLQVVGVLFSFSASRMGADLSPRSLEGGPIPQLMQTLMREKNAAQAPRAKAPFKTALPALPPQPEPKSPPAQPVVKVEPQPPREELFREPGPAAGNKTLSSLMATNNSGAGSFVGMKLVDVQEIIGKPRAVMKVGGKTTYFFPNVELISADGVTVSAQR